MTNRHQRQNRDWEPLSVFWPGERLASRLAPVPTGPVGRAEVFGLFLKDNRNLLRDQAGVKTGV